MISLVSLKMYDSWWIPGGVMQKRMGGKISIRNMHLVMMCMVSLRLDSRQEMSALWRHTGDVYLATLYAWTRSPAWRVAMNNPQLEPVKHLNGIGYHCYWSEKLSLYLLLCLTLASSIPGTHASPACLGWESSPLSPGFCVQRAGLDHRCSHIALMLSAEGCWCPVACHCKVITVSLPAHCCFLVWSYNWKVGSW